MKSKFILVMVLLLTTIVMLTSCVSQSAYDDLRSQLSATQSLLSTMREEVSEYQTKVLSLEQQLEDSQSQLAQAQDQLVQTQENLKLYQDTGIIVYKDITPNVNTSITFNSGINLMRNPNAHNPTWAELMAFIIKDKTDSKLYGINLCGWFAEQVFNNAEAQGINAAFVIVDFEQGIGHALNAFNTVDRGLVYIDCTGERLQPQYPSFFYVTIGDIGSNDKIAYIEKGKPMGNISVGTSYGLSYSDFEQWNRDVQIMLDRFNAATTNEKLYKIKSESDTKLGSFWELEETPDNIVKSVEICW